MTLPDWILEIEKKDNRVFGFTANEYDQRIVNDVQRLIDSLKIALEALEFVVNGKSDHHPMEQFFWRKKAAREALAKIRGE